MECADVGLGTANRRTHSGAGRKCGGERRRGRGSRVELRDVTEALVDRGARRGGSKKAARQSPGVLAEKKKITAGIERLMDDAKYLLAQSVHGREKIAATDEIELRDERIGERIEPPEDHAVANGGSDRVAPMAAGEKTPQAGRRHLRRGRSCVNAGPRDGKRLFVDVRTEDDEPAVRLPFHHFGEEDRDRIRVLPRRATGHPDPQRRPVEVLIHERRKSRLRQLREAFRVIEERAVSLARSAAQSLRHGSTRSS